MRVAIISVLLVATPGFAAGQEPSVGPVIDSAGATFEIPAPDFTIPVGLDLSLAFEMARPSATPSEPNIVLDNVARFLNMHARAGLPRSQVRAAVVVHGGAAWEMLGNEAYREQHGVDNPNVALIRALTDAGVRVIVCGQSVMARGVPRAGLADGVQVALSAMTAFLVLQEEGFKANPW